MNRKLDPFVRHALADQYALTISSVLTESEQAALLLWKTYLKRIRPVPKPVLEAAVAAYRNGEELVGIQIQDVDDVGLVMDKVGDLVWNTLDEVARREWLLKI